MWSNIKPSCIRRTCDEAPVGRFTFVQCTDNENLGSVCTYKCLTHHRLVGPASTQCIDDGGDLVWDSAAPNCEHIECPDLGTIENGNVICPLSTNYVNSVCYFTCNDEFQPEPDTSLTTCQNDSTWTNAKPTCLPTTCSLLPSIQHGDASCTNSNLLHSVCTFTCDDEHMLHGSDSTMCGGNGEWTSPPPACVRVVCTEQTKPSNGSMSCNHGNNEGSVCSFECYSTHELVGEFEIQCVTQAGTLPVWTGETPSCILRKNCGSLPTEPVGGYVVCTDEIFLDSECEFACDGFRTRVGALYTMCVEDGGDMKWDNPTPVCERTQCPDQGSIANGTMSCTDGNYANSVCSYSCDNDNYALTPSGVVDNVCNNDTTWNLPKPCCSKICPPYSVVDAVILLDSSSSIGNENWRTMKAFIRQVIDSFVIRDDAARLAIFRFNSQIDTRTQILLGDYSNDKQGLLRAFDRIPYDGEGTRTGAALNHARNVMLAPANGNRDGVPDSVFIITDGVSQDHVTTAANLLREQGVEVYAIGVVPPKGRLNRRQLMDIAGEPDNLVIAERGFDGLDQSLFDQIQQQICTEGCFEHLNLR
ncbi:P-selectin-like [Ciona intestinalis]